MHRSTVSLGVVGTDDALSEHQRARARRWVGVFGEAWATGDWRRLLEQVHPNASVFYPGMPAETDREGLREFFEGGFATMPDFRISLKRWAAAGDDVLIEWDATGTVGGEQVAWSGMDRFSFGAEQIVEARAYYDTRPILEAIERGLSAKESPIR